ncbi:putative MFS monocarboxylate transporter [Westerdykella ornata]|uniref:Putative MFS monocarboxylate transporter n=1 Tax=Westerdykella ornata TaxID=318751 RepID=A0A6A6JKF9_WESOR|nr:putative MFS monocarboxylate transporter [Westerdykella ornata]KAF2276997.1 putative MFS monocarboxylate transporter [Westerdykella ornata]
MLGDDGQQPNATAHGNPDPTIDEFVPAPEGGTRAWIVAAGGGAIFFSTLGFANSFGTFEEYYLSHQLKDWSASDISWIGSLAIFLQFFAGMLSGPLFDRYGEKVIRPASALYVLFMMMLSLCNSYWSIMLVQGVLMGTVMGLLQIPAFAAVSQYFEKNRAGSLGLVASGSSIGGIIIPIALSKMLNGSSLGFGWSVRIIGFIILPFVLFAAAGVKPRLPPRKTDFWLISAYKDGRFVILIIALFFMFFGMLTPFFYLPTYAVSRGMSPTLAGYLLSILNAASTFGRIIPGVLADKWGKINMFGFGGVITGIVIYTMNAADTNAGLVVYAVCFGFTSGTIISGGSAAFSTCPKDARNVGTYMGMGMAIAGLGGLVGPPVNGAIVNAYGGFHQVCMLSGTLCLVGGLIAISAKRWTPQGLLGNV